MSDTLLPCPFCGKPAELHYDSDHHGNWFNLGCSDEFCHAHHAFYTEELREVNSAIEAWNQRVPCDKCDRIEKWVDHAGCLPNKAQRYEKLLTFVTELADDACWSDDALRSLPGAENEIALKARELLREIEGE